MRVGTRARSRTRERLDGKTEMTILRVRLETAGGAKILCKLTLGEVNTNISEIGTSRALMTVQDDMTLKRCNATEGMEKVVMAKEQKADARQGIVTVRAGSTAGSGKAGSPIACARTACSDGGVTRSNAYSGQSKVCTQLDAQAHDQRTTHTHELAL